MKISVSTTGRILIYLKERGYLKETSIRRSFYTKKRPKRDYAIRKPKNYTVEKPGDLVHIDTLDIHPFPSIHLKHFTARDVISRWDVIETFPRASSLNVKTIIINCIKPHAIPSQSCSSGWQQRIQETL